MAQGRDLDVCVSRGDVKPGALINGETSNPVIMVLRYETFRVAAARSGRRTQGISLLLLLLFSFFSFSFPGPFVFVCWTDERLWITHSHYVTRLCTYSHENAVNRGSTCPHPPPLLIHVLIAAHICNRKPQRITCEYSEGSRFFKITAKY